MFLKNYTSNVPVSETIARIEKVLIRCGVLAINKEYAPPPASEITAILFSIETHKGKVDIRLPKTTREIRNKFQFLPNKARTEQLRTELFLCTTRWG